MTKQRKPNGIITIAQVTAYVSYVEFPCLDSKNKVRNSVHSMEVELKKREAELKQLLQSNQASAARVQKYEQIIDNMKQTIARWYARQNVK